MRLSPLLCLAFAGWSLLAPLSPAHAQGAGSRAGVSGGARQPEGKNGYGDLLAAAEALKASKLWAKAELLSGTLSEKRLALGDRPVQRALALVRQGLSKPVVVPQERRDPDALPPHLAGFRSLGRLVAVHQYVALADGRTTEALADARLGMYLGRTIQQESLLGGLVGVAVSAICIRQLAAHLDQLSARDCDLLKAICEEWLALPGPLPRVLMAERQGVLTRLELLRRTVPAEVAAGGEDPFGVTQKYAGDYFDRLLLEVKKPTWQRAVPRTGAAPEFAQALLTPIAEALEGTLPAYVREEAQVRMLAVHALILRSRWENGRLPSSLEALNPGDLARDPFTGTSLQYEVQGRTYRLHSAGPPAEGSDPRAVNGRKPLAVVPE